MSDAIEGSASGRLTGRRDEGREREPDEVMASRIAGVCVVRIPGYHDHRGSVYSIDMRMSFWSEPILHSHLFTLRPGRIKGWAMHQRQADRYFSLSGNLRTALYDDREDSSDRGHICEFFFTPESPGLLYIPAGVWHATQNWGSELGRVMNFPTAAFDPAHPDKQRLDPTTTKIPFDWNLKDG
jgi:dTDP-4-dehydrorhamnose 3,5-epimerase